MNFLSFHIFVCISLAFPAQLTAQYIHEILEYRPAPGQHINGPAGTPDAAQSIIGTTTGLVSLGAFGGSITFRFAHPVSNNPDNLYGMDFTIFGNSVGQWSEPGIVSVMYDLNGNGKADDTWYELAGSEYNPEESSGNYSITYFNPGDNSDVRWEDNTGKSGFVYTNSLHTQAYYPDPERFPNINNSSYTLSGPKLYKSLDSSNNMLINSPTLDFGYADNHMRGSAPYTNPDNPDTPETEGAGGDPMDISWAVDHNGMSVQLDTIHFIKVHTAVNGHAGILGEISTEISGAVIVNQTATNETGNRKHSEKAAFKIFPNPVEHMLHISGGEIAEIRLFSLGGKLLCKKDYLGTPSSMDVSGLDAGVYLLRIYGETKSFTEKIIKQ